MTKGWPTGDPRARAHGQKGGLVRGEQRKRESIALWLQRFPGITPDAAREIYDAGYAAGWQIGRRRAQDGREAR